MAISGLEESIGQDDVFSVEGASEELAAAAHAVLCSDEPADESADSLSAILARYANRTENASEVTRVVPVAEEFELALSASLYDHPEREEDILERAVDLIRLLRGAFARDFELNRGSQ